MPGKSNYLNLQEIEINDFKETKEETPTFKPGQNPVINVSIKPIMMSESGSSVDVELPDIVV